MLVETSCSAAHAHDDASMEKPVCSYGIMPRMPTDAPPGVLCVSMVSPRSECSPAPKHRLTIAPSADDTARAIARALIEGFDKHYALFRDCARAAKRHFEAGNFLAIGHVARDRIDFYDRRVDEAAERIEREFGSAEQAGSGADVLWASVKLHYIALLVEHRQPECAETFFNSVSCKLLHRTLLPQPLPVRAAGGVDRVPRRRSADLPQLLSAPRAGCDRR